MNETSVFHRAEIFYSSKGIFSFFLNMPRTISNMKSYRNSSNLLHMLLIYAAFTFLVICNTIFACNSTLLAKNQKESFSALPHSVAVISSQLLTQLLAECRLP